MVADCGVSGGDVLLLVDVAWDVSDDVSPAVCTSHVFDRSINQSINQNTFYSGTIANESEALNGRD